MKPGSTSTEKFAFKLGARQFQISRDFRKNTNQSNEPELFVRRNSNVMLTAEDRRCQANIAACLPADNISVATEELRKVRAAEVSRQLQALMTSS